ncbi:MAG TPA: S41 family peptidase [Nitrospirota bacterium]|nr:S41 family peptidase [Nitrospirota bacterium]
MDKQNRLVNARGTGSLLLMLAAGLLIGAVLHAYILPDPYPPSFVPPEAASDFRLMAEAWNAIEQNYVDRPSVKPRSMTYGAIAGMVDSLGDTGHSGFLNPDMVQAEHTIESGQFAGIGAEIQMKNNQVVVVAPIDGSPAQKAGIRPGDIIIDVDGRDVTGLSLQEVVQKIMGPAGTVVALMIEDPVSGQERTLTIRRANITLQSVTWHLLPDQRTAHVRIAFFSKGTSQNLEKALAEIEQRGAKGVILDLRNDPGGLLDMAVGVASQFLESGTVLEEKNAKGELRSVAVEKGVRKCGLPMAVLTNAGTASASEIVAGALQDAKRAAIVGEKTFGTGTVLNAVPLSDGSALLLAVMEWLTPNGRVIWHKGITPDIVVSLPADGAPLLPEAERGMSLAELRSHKDLQLLRALDALRGT